MSRPIDGVFEVLVDEDGIADQMERAYNNKSRVCCQGNLIVRYQPASKAEADFLVKGTAFGKQVEGAGVSGTDWANLRPDGTRHRS